MGLIVDSLSVAKHSHDIREDNTRSVVLVCVEKDTQTLEHVLVTKDRTLLCSVGGHPHGKAVTEEVALAIDIELNLNLPVGSGQGNSRIDPAGLRRAVGTKTNVLVGADDGVAAKVPPSALKVRVKVGLNQRMRAKLVKCQKGGQSLGGSRSHVIRGCSSRQRSPEHLRQLATSRQQLRAETRSAWRME